MFFLSVGAMYAWFFDVDFASNESDRAHCVLRPTTPCYNTAGVRLQRIQRTKRDSPAERARQAVMNGHDQPLRPNRPAILPLTVVYLSETEEALLDCQMNSDVLRKVGRETILLLGEMESASVMDRVFALGQRREHHVVPIAYASSRPSGFPKYPRRRSVELELS